MHGPTVLQTGVGVRAAGLGEAYVGVADDTSALYWNPAGIDQTPVQEVLLMRGDSFWWENAQILGYLVPFWAAGERQFASRIRGFRWTLLILWRKGRP